MRYRARNGGLRSGRHSFSSDLRASAHPLHLTIIGSYRPSFFSPAVAQLFQTGRLSSCKGYCASPGQWRHFGRHNPGVIADIATHRGDLCAAENSVPTRRRSGSISGLSIAASVARRAGTCRSSSGRSWARSASPDFAAFMQNDEALVAHHAFDLARLRRHCAKIETSSDLCVVKELPKDASARAGMDRDHPRHASCMSVAPGELLSRELELSRSLIARLAADGVLTVLPQTRKGVRGMIADGQVVTIAMAQAGGAASDALAQAMLAGRFSGVTLSEVT